MIQKAALCDVLPWLQALSVAHHEETSPTDTPLSIDWSLLTDMDVNGGLLCLVACTDQIVGYSLHILSSHPLYGELWATPIALYVKPSARHLGFGRQLIERAEAECRLRDVAVLCEVSPAGLAPLGVLLSGLGFHKAESLWIKRLPVLSH